MGSAATATAEDLARALRDARLQRRWARLPKARRRELVRWIDAARTPRNRQTRVARTVEHVRGEPAPAAHAEPAAPLWTCPACGHAFVQKHQWHSCTRHTVEEVLAGKPPAIRDLFARVRARIEAFGRVTIVPYRDRVAFMVRVRFAAAVPKRGWLDVDFWLKRRVDHPRFRRVETLTPTDHIYSVRVTSPRDLDAELVAWLREAHAVGCQTLGRVASRNARAST